ncbi:hypothetical protein FB45DRAFT_32064, partial [Roridomyces roridus]
LLTDQCSWLSQANHVFHRLNITSRHEDYAYVCHALFRLNIAAPARPDIPRGYLFVCPIEHLRTVRGAWFGWPQRPWFWSLNPLGGSHLTPEGARSLGFPEVEQKPIRVWSRRWDTSVYEGLAKFHAAKGFDPYSQDLAKHLGHPLLELPGDAETFHAHVNEMEEEGLDEMEDTDADAGLQKLPHCCRAARSCGRYICRKVFYTVELFHVWEALLYATLLYLESSRNRD